MSTSASVSETHEAVTLTGIRADLFVEMTREQAARLIRDLATAMAERDTVELRVRVSDRTNFQTGEKVGMVEISDLRYGINPATATVFDCSVVTAS